MDRYRNLHFWMLIPMAIMQIGIARDYWVGVTDKAWSIHIHYWTATLWYAYLIAQPYFATHRQLDRHRTSGMIGFFLAGGVAFTAMSMLHRDLATAERSAQMPDRFGPFEPWFFYGIATVEFVMMAAFVFAVIQAIRHRRSLENHAWWLISTVFIIMMPALGRGAQALWFFNFGVSETGMKMSIYVTVGLIVAMTLWAAARFGRIGHPATCVAVGVNLFILLYEPLGKWESWQGVLRSVIRG